MKKHEFLWAWLLGAGWGAIIVAGVSICVSGEESSLLYYAGAILAIGALLVFISTVGKG